MIIAEAIRLNPGHDTKKIYQHYIWKCHISKYTFLQLLWERFSIKSIESSHITHIKRDIDRFNNIYLVSIGSQKVPQHPLLALPSRINHESN